MERKLTYLLREINLHSAKRLCVAHKGVKISQKIRRVQKSSSDGAVEPNAAAND